MKFGNICKKRLPFREYEFRNALKVSTTRGEPWKLGKAQSTTRKSSGKRGSLWKLVEAIGDVQKLEEARGFRKTRKENLGSS